MSTEDPRVTPEQRRRNLIVGGSLVMFAIAVAAASVWLLASTGFNPFEEHPQFIIKPERN